MGHHGHPPFSHLGPEGQTLGPGQMLVICKPSGLSFPPVKWEGVAYMTVRVTVPESKF